MAVTVSAQGLARSRSRALRDRRRRRTLSAWGICPRLSGRLGGLGQVECESPHSDSSAPTPGPSSPTFTHGETEAQRASRAGGDGAQGVVCSLIHSFAHSFIHSFILSVLGDASSPAQVLGHMGDQSPSGAEMDTGPRSQAAVCRAGCREKPERDPRPQAWG